MTSKIVLCGIDTSKLPKYTAKEQLDMLKRIQSGENELKTNFIYGNLRLVLSVMHRFLPRYPNAEDLFQVGCVGLIKAIDNFDLTLNVQFSTYAVPMIIGEIRRYLRDNNMVRVSRSIRDLAYKALQAKEKLTKEKHKEPTVEEIAKELSVPKEEIVMCLDAIQDPMSLQEPVYNDGSENLYIMDQVRDTKNTEEQWSNNITISEAFKKLNEREKMIIRRRFFAGKTQMEVAEEIGISQAQVSRLEKSAISHIKKMYN